MQGRTTHAVIASSLAVAALGLAAIPATARTSTHGHHGGAHIAAKAPAFGTQWVANEGNQSLVRLAPRAGAPATPVADIVGAATTLDNPAGVAIDASGRVWTANISSSAITAFAANATGNVAPVVTISGAATGIDAPYGIAFGPNGDLWVANYGDSNILEFARGANGNVAPVRTIAGPKTTLDSTTGVAVSADGKQLWVSEGLIDAGTPGPALLRFSTAARGNVRPTATIGGSKTELNEPFSIALGLPGNTVTVANSAAPYAVLTFAGTAHGNVKPKVAITGSKTAMDVPGLISIDATGQVWVPNESSNIIDVFDPRVGGNVPPAHQVAGTNAGPFNHPDGVAVYGKAPSAPRSFRAHGNKKALHFSWVGPKLRNGGILGYFIRRAHNRHGPWTTVKTVTLVKSARLAHPKKHTYYDIEVFNDKGISAPSAAVRPKL